MSEEQVDITFDVNDKATPKLTRLEKSADRLDGAMGRATEKFSRFSQMVGGLAGVVGGAESLRGAKALIDHADRLVNLTGMAASRVAGMSEALQVSGVEAGEVEGIMARMVKRSTLLTEENKAQAKLAERYGINLTQGPEKSLLAISKLVEQSKIDAGQVGRILGVQGTTLANLYDAMGKGPATLNRMFDDATSKNAFLGGETMDMMQEYDESVARVSLAWRRMFAGVIVKVAPAITRMAAKLESNIEGWSSKAGKFATALIDNMSILISMAKTYAKIMLVNTLSQKLTGRGAVANMMMLGGNAGAGIMGGAGAGGAKMLREMFTGVVKIRPLLTIFARFALIGGAVAVIYFTFKKILEATDGAGLRIKQMFGTIWANLQAIGRQFTTMFASDSSLGKFFRWLGEDGLVGVIEKITGLFDNMIYGLRVLLTMMTERVGFGKAKDIIISQTYADSGLEKMVRGGRTPSLRGDVPDGPTAAITAAMRAQFTEFDKARATYEAAGGPKMWNEAQLTAMRKRYATPAKAGATPENNVYQDFRGSRFDVTQQFAEGFDPDRIAVGFANDIAALGERRLQSGFSPLFTVR